MSRKSGKLDGTASDIKFTSADIALAGTPGLGEAWKLTLNGTPYSFNTTDTNLSTVATGLKNALTTAGYTATVVNNTTVHVSSATSFTLQFAVAGPNPTGTATISGTPANTTTADQQALANIHWTSAAFALGGTYKDGETWNVSVGTHTYTYVAGTASYSHDLAGVAQGLAAAVANTYAPSASNGVLTLSSAAGVTVGMTITPAASAGTLTTSTSFVSTYVIGLASGTTTVPDGTWTITLDGQDYSATTKNGSGTVNGIVIDLADALNHPGQGGHSPYNATPNGPLSS